MEIQDVMKERNFAILGDTLNPDKYAFKIRQAMLEAGYQVACVGKELQSLNQVPFEIDVIDLCIHPIKGLKLLKETDKPFKMIVIQPGAEDEALIEYLDSRQLPYIRGCLLKGLQQRNL